MKVSSFAVARPAYYDRAAITKNLAYGAANVAPHANTTRFTYTVPAGRKMFVESACVASFRDTAAAVVGQQFMNVVMYDGTTYCNLIANYYYTTALGAVQNQILGNSATVYAGHQVIGATWDFSTGGTQDLRLSVKGSEYDA
jgi:hypothetical protein